MNRIVLILTAFIFLMHLGCATGGGDATGRDTGPTMEIKDDRGFSREMGPAEIEYQSAQQFLAARDYQEAISHLRQATQIKPTYLEAWSDLGKTLMQIKDYEGAIQALERARDLATEDTRLISNIGYCYLYLQNWDKAEEYYNMLVTKQPANFDGNVKLGYIYQMREDIDNAIKYYKLAENIQPDDATVLGSLATLYGKKGEKAVQIEYQLKAIEAAPDNYKFKVDLGKLYFNDKEYGKAIPIYESLAEQYPDVAQYHQRLGFALSQTDRKAEAPAVLEKAIELKDDDPFIFAILAKIYNESKQYQKAIRTANSGLALGAGQEPFLYYQWGEALSKLGEYEGAIVKFRKVISYNDPTWTDPARKQIPRQEALIKRAKALKDKEQWE